MVRFRRELAVENERPARGVRAFCGLIQIGMVGENGRPGQATVMPGRVDAEDSPPGDHTWPFEMMSLMLKP